jgi:hypothetical protein
MPDWHDCCNTIFREDGAFRALCYSAGQRAGGDFGCWRSRKRECGYSLAFSVAPNAALSQQLCYDRRRLDYRLAEGRYVDTITLIFSPASSRAKWMAPNLHRPNNPVLPSPKLIVEGRYFLADVTGHMKNAGPGRQTEGCYR